MRKFTSFRSLVLQGATLAGLLACASLGAFGQHGGQRGGGARPAPVIRRAPAAGLRGSAVQQRPAPIERRAPGAAPVVRGAPGGAMVGANPVAKGEHLGDWMSRHSNLSPAQQQQALERSPDFRQLPPDQQQRERNQLARLNAMPQDQRQRTLERTEMMERLSPDQRVQVRGAMQQLGALPPDQRQMVARSFRELRGLPPEERVAAMNSARYGYLNPAQRATLNNLIRVEPMLPPR